MRSLRYQRGFLYLTTGANGAGKTLFTLQDVRKLQLETGRPVYYWGFTPKKPIEDFGWLPFEPENWQDLPDGSICLIDECQKVMPLRSTGKPPAWIDAIAEVHRKRGFDFFLITQHPMNFDAFIRRLIATPGWHRHFKASMLGDSSNELRWSAVMDQPQKPHTGDSGEITSRAFPKEVYGWYESASKHTAKKGIPLKVWGGIAALIVAIAMIGWVVMKLAGFGGGAGDSPQKPVASQIASPLPSGAANQGPRDTAQAQRKTSLTADEYIAERTPRLSDFPHTAPAYDGVTSPSVAPYPAACVQMGKTCKCYTQQATLLQVSGPVCLQIVRQGFFVDWDQRTRSEPSPRADQRADALQAPNAAQSQPVRTVPMPMPAARSEPREPIGQWAQGLAARNLHARGVSAP
jgi:zona occludens toxin